MSIPSSNETLSKVSKEIKDLVFRGVYSLFPLINPSVSGVYFVLVTDKIQNGEPLVFWLNQSGTPIDLKSKPDISRLQFGEKINFETNDFKALNYSR